MIRKEKRPIHIPTSYRMTVQRFVLVIRHFLSPKRYILSLLLLFFVILLVYSFFEKFFDVFPCAKQNNGENILQNSESLVAMTHVVKISCSLGILKLT